VARIVVTVTADVPGELWRWSIVEEDHVKVAGEWAYVYRAVDQPGRVIDVLLSVRRDLAEPPPPLAAGNGRP
jgi:transposase-like protein